MQEPVVAAVTIFHEKWQKNCNTVNYIIRKVSKKKKKVKPVYHHAVCTVSVCPLRKKSDDRAEIVSQLLFGELVKLVSKKNKSWAKVECEWDGYVGWLDPKMVTPITEDEYLKLQQERSYSIDISQPVTADEHAYPILLASSLPGYDGMSLSMAGQQYVCNGHTITPSQVEITPELLIKVAKKYLHAPYLWGGRSPFGIDCSGLTQCIFKVFGIRLPRDAYQQAEQGHIVDFVETAEVGDLAFFENKEGHIHHVGIILEDKDHSRSYCTAAQWNF